LEINVTDYPNKAIGEKGSTRSTKKELSSLLFPHWIPVLFSIIKSRMLVYVFAVITFGTFLITAGANIPDLFTLIAATAASYLVALATYLYNDLTDYTVDKINQREIIHDQKKSLQYQTTLYSMIGFFAISILLSFSISIATGVSSLIFAGLAIAYSHPRTHLKDRFITKTVVTGAGAFVASVMGMTAAVAETDVFSNIALMSSVIAFLFYFILGPLGDIGDIRGDRQGGRKTIPIVIGIKRTFLLMDGIVVFIGVIFAVSYFVFGMHVIGLVLGLTVCSVFLFQINDVSKHYKVKSKLKKTRTTLRYSVFATLIAMWMGVVLRDIVVWFEYGVIPLE